MRWDVRRHRRSGRVCPSTAALQHEIAYKISLHDDGVEHAIGVRNRRALGHEGGIDALLNAFRMGDGNAEQLDLVAHVAGIADVIQGDGLDALDLDSAEIYLRAESQRCDHRQFVSRIKAADIESRIGFGVAQVLCFLQNFGEAPALIGHLGEDVVASAVHDAEELGNTVADQAFAQRLDDGNAARNGGLEIQRNALGLGGAGQCSTMMGQQGLVGGDDMLACGNGRFDR